MLHRITVGLKGGILRVASVAEIAERLLLLVGGASSWLRTGLSCPWGAVITFGIHPLPVRAAFVGLLAARRRFGRHSPLWAIGILTRM